MEKRRTHIQLGRLRSIELFDEIDFDKEDEYKYLIESEKVKIVFEKDKPLIIGLVDNIHCLLIDQYKQGPVFIDFSFLNENELIQVADSLAKLGEILSQVNEIWKGNEDHFSLKKDHATIEHCKKIMRSIGKENPNSDLLFWRYYAFRELEIDLF